MKKPPPFYQIPAPRAAPHPTAAVMPGKVGTGEEWERGEETKVLIGVSYEGRSQTEAYNRCE